MKFIQKTVGHKNGKEIKFGKEKEYDLTYVELFKWLSEIVKEHEHEIKHLSVKIQFDFWGNIEINV